MDWLNKKENYVENNRKNVCDKYLSLTDPSFVKKINKEDKSSSICHKCNIEKIVHLSEGNMICTKCGEISYIVIDSDKPSVIKTHLKKFHILLIKELIILMNG